MLETIREYAGERLDEAGERAGDGGRARRPGARAGRDRRTAPARAEQLAWLARLRAEADEIAAVLRRAVAAGDAATAHRLVAAMALVLVDPRAVHGGTCAGWRSVRRSPVPSRSRSTRDEHRLSGLVGRRARRRHPASDRAADAPRLAAACRGRRHPSWHCMTPMAARFAARRSGAARPARRRSAGRPVGAGLRHVHRWPSSRRTRASSTISGRPPRGARAVRRTRRPLRAGDVGARAGRAGGYGGGVRRRVAAYDEAIALAAELGNDDDLPQFHGQARPMLRPSR